MAADLYQVLGVGKKAKQDEIRRAARKRAGETHPDRNPGDKAKAKEYTQVILARDVLTDPLRRQRYDESGDTSSEPDNRNATLVCTLSQVFQATLGLLKEAGRDFRREDLSSAMRAFIIQRLEALAEQVAHFKDCLKQLEPLKGRFSTKQGENLMEVVVKAEQDKLEMEIKRLEIIVTNLKDADAWLKGCSFKKDEDVLAKAMASMMNNAYGKSFVFRTS